ncbi:hypothetical protein [uncultured Brevibacillus sp.]|uniref:hypothetical protein n=1 Tax=uncultured Brevibacillus sp. TaxID=169970 RepID=UPI002595B011|nr:hypothetical protein [uncultured Brevibacillus sp.]
MKNNKGTGNYDQTISKLTYSITQLVNRLESRLNQAKEYELLLFGYQISTLMNLLVRLHLHIHKKQIAHSFLSEQQPRPFDNASETYAHILASLAQLSEFVSNWNFPHTHIKAIIEGHLRQLQAFYLVDEGTSQMNPTHKAVVPEQEKFLPYEVPIQPDLEEGSADDSPMPAIIEELMQSQTDQVYLPPLLLGTATRIRRNKHRKVVSPNPPLLTKTANIPTPKKKKKKKMSPKRASKVVKVRAQKKMKARRVPSSIRPPYQKSSVVVRIGDVTHVM